MNWNGYTPRRFAIVGGSQGGKSYLAREKAREEFALARKAGLDLGLFVHDPNGDWNVANVVRVYTMREACEAFGDGQRRILYVGTEPIPLALASVMWFMFVIMEEAADYMSPSYCPPGPDMLYRRGSSHHCCPLMTLSQRPRDLPGTPFANFSEAFVFPLTDESDQKKIARGLSVPARDLVMTRFRSVETPTGPHPTAFYPLHVKKVGGVQPYPYVLPGSKPPTPAAAPPEAAPAGA